MSLFREKEVFGQLNTLEKCFKICYDIDQGIHKGKMKVARNEKRKKTAWVFSFHKHSKF